jgi:hypothetical protein
MTTFPIDRYLVPEAPPAVPAGFTAVRQSLTAGLPQRVELGGGVHAILVLPTGLARQWLDADPLDVVSTSADDLATGPAVADPGPGLARRAPLRLVVRRGAQVLAAVPLAAGLRRTCADGGVAGRGAAVELVVVGWQLCAGTVRGPGDYGSYVELGWRPADKPIDIFGPPPVHRFVLRRKPLSLRIESEFGLLRTEFLLLADKKLRRLAR